jgi:hypothetical protein
MGKMKNMYEILAGMPEAKDLSEHLGVDVRIILEWISGK